MKYVFSNLSSSPPKIGGVRGGMSTPFRTPPTLPYPRGGIANEEYCTNNE